MDWLDKVSVAAILGLTSVTMAMLANHEIMKRRHHNPGVVAREQKSPYMLQMEIDKKIYQEVISYKERGLYAKAIIKLQDIMQKYPEKSLSYVYLAEIHLKQGKLGDAIHNYRRAVEMEPDYVDKRTPFFIGGKIKELVKEGLEKFGREKALRPKDKEVRRILKDLYYLQSRLAGGCE